MWDLNQAILETFGALARRAGKAYCYPSQFTILGLVGRFYGLKRSRRTLNRHLSLLEAWGYFKRVRRHIKGKDGRLILRSTLYKLRGKFFRRMGWILQAAQGFCSVFRVPFMAHHQGKTDQVSSSFPGLSVNNPADNPQKGGPPGVIKGVTPLSGPENPTRIGELIKKTVA